MCGGKTPSGVRDARPSLRPSGAKLRAIRASPKKREPFGSLFLLQQTQENLAHVDVLEQGAHDAADVQAGGLLHGLRGGRRGQDSLESAEVKKESRKALFF